MRTHWIELARLYPSSLYTPSVNRDAQALIAEIDRRPDYRVRAEADCLVIERALVAKGLAA